jgi:hypothetical protein
MAERVSEFGVSSDRVRMIPNWADGNIIAPLDRERNALRLDVHLNGRGEESVRRGRMSALIARSWIRTPARRT